MAKITGGSQGSLVLIVVGGHAVGSALLEGHTKQAIAVALGIAAILIIFATVDVLVTWLNNNTLLKTARKPRASRRKHNTSNRAL